MICKERNPLEHPETDKFYKAGANAERQMAFYLKRAFVDEPNIRVFNDLRFKMDDDDVAQIDHLVLHKHGFIIIESKSVTTKVSINKHGEWTRTWNNKPEGVPSPIQQAKRQIAFLKRGLNAYKQELVGKIFGLLQAGFTNCPCDVLIAISDKGIINRGNNKLPEVVRADQVTDRIKKIISREKKRLLLIPINIKDTEAVYNFKKDEMEKISQWLLVHHYPIGQKPPPLQKKATPPPLPGAAPTQPTDELGICNKCNEQATIKWGKYSYYWKCLACDNNMSIKLICPSCNDKMKIRKSKTQFYKYCDPCKTEELYCEIVEE